MYMGEESSGRPLNQLPHSEPSHRLSVLFSVLQSARRRPRLKWMQRGVSGCLTKQPIALLLLPCQDHDDKHVLRRLSTVHLASISRTNATSTGPSSRQHRPLLDIAGPLRTCPPVTWGKTLQRHASSELNRQTGP